VDARPEIASGLDVSESQVYFTKDKKSDGATRCGYSMRTRSPTRSRTPLLDCKQRSVWHKFPFGLDQFGRRVASCLMWLSLLIVPSPAWQDVRRSAHRPVLRARPYVNITLIDGKSSKDWQPIQLVAHRFVQGTHANRDETRVDKPSPRCARSSSTSFTSTTSSKKLPTSSAPQGS